VTDERPTWDIVLLERVAVGARLQPAIAVALALGAVVWLTLSATSWVGLRFFLASLAAVTGGAATYLVALNRGRPDRSWVRPADLPLRLTVDGDGLHLIEDRGPREHIAWREPHDLAVWVDPAGRPVLLRVASAEVTWTFTGGLGETVPEGLPTVPLRAVAAAYARTDALARRHAPWELLFTVGAGGDLLPALVHARAAAPRTPLWRVPLDAEFDPTARWTLRFAAQRLVVLHGGEPEDELDLRAPFEVALETIEAAVLPETPPRRLRRLDLRQGTAFVRLSLDPAAQGEPTALPGAPTEARPTDVPRLVPPDWVPVLLDHVGLDLAGRRRA
jgi:hypothetical protein